MSAQSPIDLSRSSDKSKRRTKTLGGTNEPRWNQSFSYSSVRRADLKVKEIEISVWDYTGAGINDFLGEVSKYNTTGQCEMFSVQRK